MLKPTILLCLLPASPKSHSYFASSIVPLVRVLSTPWTWIAWPAGTVELIARMTDFGAPGSPVLSSALLLESSLSLLSWPELPLLSVSSANMFPLATAVEP